jgi:hypothetical protein
MRFLPGAHAVLCEIGRFHRRERVRSRGSHVPVTVLHLLPHALWGFDKAAFAQTSHAESFSPRRSADLRRCLQTGPFRHRQWLHFQFTCRLNPAERYLSPLQCVQMLKHFVKSNMLPAPASFCARAHLGSRCKFLCFGQAIGWVASRDSDRYLTPDYRSAEGPTYVVSLSSLARSLARSLPHLRTVVFPIPAFLTPPVSSPSSLCHSKLSMSPPGPREASCLCFPDSKKRRHTPVGTHFHPARAWTGVDRWCRIYLPVSNTRIQGVWGGRYRPCRAEFPAEACAVSPEYTVIHPQCKHNSHASLISSGSVGSEPLILSL